MINLLDRTQSEYRAIEKLLTPRLQEMLDKAIDMYRDEAGKIKERDYDQEALWQDILKQLPISHYEGRLLDIANAIWSGNEIKMPLMEFRGFDPSNIERVVNALCTYWRVEHLLVKRTGVD